MSPATEAHGFSRQLIGAIIFTLALDDCIIFVVVLNLSIHIGLFLALALPLGSTTLFLRWGLLSFIVNGLVYYEN